MLKVGDKVTVLEDTFVGIGTLKKDTLMEVVGVREFLHTSTDEDYGLALIVEGDSNTYSLCASEVVKVKHLKIVKE